MVRVSFKSQDTQKVNRFHYIPMRGNQIEKMGITFVRMEQGILNGELYTSAIYSTILILILFFCCILLGAEPIKTAYLSNFHTKAQKKE